jgi:PAS domain S-box-containing protein
MSQSAAGPADVLHVDDDSAILGLSEEVLPEHGDSIRLTTTTEPGDALARLEAGEFECVVSDYQMPEMDGLELLSAVREHRPHVPFILFTGKGSEEIASDAVSAGVTDYIQKRTGSEQWEMLANKIRRGVDHYRTERELRESEQRYRTLVERSHDGIFIYQDEAFVFVNERCAEISGYEREEILGRHISEAVPSDETDRVLRMARRRADDEDAAQTYRTRILTKSGEQRHVSLSVQSITYEGRYAVLGSARDVTEQVQRERQLQRERDRHSALFENIAVPVVYYEFADGEPLVREVNPAFEERFGYEGSAITGEKLDDLVVPPSYVEEGQDINRRVRNGEIVDTDVIRRAADDLRRFHLLSVPLSPGESGERGYALYTDEGPVDDPGNDGTDV